MSQHEVKPYRIVIEWTNSQDFFFSCDYKVTHDSTNETEVKPLYTHWFPHVTRAMGNVLKKLRREHITFPLFLISLAFEHRHLLREIDELLRALHAHLGNQQGPGSYRCFICGERKQTVTEC
ncbi:hypothetical protein CR164_08660 [Prosthecochloris marina]|uniref:Uncharacterized protein n=2 Tax=Chlorobiaceae TaxID=191412 RepID=A0A317T929_9CHLB|nr:hypothetical protein [Prosthecochloris marina]PWW81926.1 hypothetical protein CR164_08660 [Prosthecochloris marina]